MTLVQLRLGLSELDLANQFGVMDQLALPQL